MLGPRWKRMVSLAILVMLLFARISSAQVSIKDRIAIHPGARRLSPLSGNCTPCSDCIDDPGPPKTYRMCMWHGPDFIRLYDDNGNKPYWNITGDTATVTAGSGYVRFYDNDYHVPVSSPFVITTGILVYADQQVPDTEGTVAITLTYPNSPTEYMNIFVYKPIFHLEVTAPNPQVNFGSNTDVDALVLNQCETASPAPDTSTSYTASVIKGTRFGVLVNPAKHDTGTTLSGLKRNGVMGWELKFVADQDNPDSVSQSVVKMWATDATIASSQCTVYVHPGAAGNFAQFRLSIAPDTIAHGGSIVPDTSHLGDTATITAVAADSNNHSVTISDTTVLTYSIDSTQYGQFISASGQLVSSPLTNVLYGDARVGKIKFIANRARDTSKTKPILVTVTGAQKSGSGIFYIGNIKLRFLNKIVRQVWPYISSSSARKFRSGYAPTRFRDTIEVAHPTGRKLANKSVFMKILYIIHSGGHGHSRSRDTIMVDTSRGRFFSQGRNNSPLDSLLTDINGRVIVDSLRASQFSGMYYILARLPADTTVFDSLAFNVKVDSLFDFGTGQYWTLSGVPGSDSVGMNHLSNHWCMQYFKDNLTQAMEDFHDFYQSQAGGSKNVTLNLNDLSLEGGGRFDIRGEWSVPPDTAHKMHRVGLGADFDRSTPEKYSLKVNDTTLSKMGEKLVKFMWDHHFGRMPEGPIHFEYGYIPPKKKN